MSNDEEGWKSNGRPQSTMALNFSAALNDAFNMDNSLDGLVESVEQKKKAVTSQSQELEALEARLRETEERLKLKQSRSSSPAPRNSGYNSPLRQPPFGRVINGKENDRLPAAVTSPLATQPPSSQSRPSTAKSRSYGMPPMPGAMPETPGDSSSVDYVMIGRDSNRQDDAYSHRSGTSGSSHSHRKQATGAF
ncbi:hypothetical protein MMC20_004090 [Loxospora ochrophaea]|nr:hypothetical protein [Loxospora ochrophaea]